LIGQGQRLTTAAWLRSLSYNRSLRNEQSELVSEEEARQDMGILKKDHIRAILGTPRILAEWQEQYQHVPDEQDVERLFADFILDRWSASRSTPH